MTDTKDELEQLAKEWMSESGGLLEVCDIGDGRTEDELTYHARIAASFALQTNADLIQERDRLKAERDRLAVYLRAIHNKHGVLDLSSHTRKQIMETYQSHRAWVQETVKEALGETGEKSYGYLFPDNIYLLRAAWNRRTAA